MIYLLPLLNALFGYGIISMLFWFLFHPTKKKDFFIIELQGLIPKKLAEWGEQIGAYVGEHFLNIGKLKADLLQPEKLQQVNTLLEGKVDDFLRNKLKEKIPIFGMFVTDGLIRQMKEVLMNELEKMIPDMIGFFADDLEKKYDVRKMISEKLRSLTIEDIEKQFYKQAGKGILQLKLACAFLGFALGWLEFFLLRM
jgi:uncharacterized membrane protein YheB (UPF0754 family)